MRNFTQDELKAKEDLINEELENKGLATISFLRIEDRKVKFFTNALKGTVSKTETDQVSEIVRKRLS